MSVLSRGFGAPCRGRRERVRSSRAVRWSTRPGSAHAVRQLDAICAGHGAEQSLTLRWGKPAEVAHRPRPHQSLPEVTAALPHGCGVCGARCPPSSCQLPSPATCIAIFVVSCSSALQVLAHRLTACRPARHPIAMIAAGLVGSYAPSVQRQPLLTSTIWSRFRASPLWLRASSLW